MEQKGSKRGYLHDDFRLFHIKDRRELEFEYHYHEFDKVVIFISGGVTYMIEGTAYFLKPWDILIVGHDQVHRPIIDSSEPYERIVLWMNPDFLESNKLGADDLSACFEAARARSFALLRPDAVARTEAIKLLYETEASLGSDEFGSKLMSRTMFLQFMVLLNRLFDADVPQSVAGAYERDAKLSEILVYISSHLNEDLSVETLAKRFFISPSYLAHRFRDQTGYSPHSYITQKRLIRACDLIRSGCGAGDAAVACGFCDYSTFLRAFKKRFGTTPRELLIKN